MESSSVYTYTGETVRPFLLDTATNVKVNDPEISENALSLDKYVAKKGYEDDSEVRTAIANSAQL